MNTSTATTSFVVLLSGLVTLAACYQVRVDGKRPVDALPPSPDLVTLRSDLLACTKARLAAGDDSLQPALKRLVDAAEAALAEEPVSVTDKKRVAPSGHLHDYVSPGPQWWPDPNRPDGLPYIPRDGFRNPEVDDDEKYDQHRLELLTNRVKALALAYYFTAREEFAQQAAAYVRTWFVDPATRMTPHLKYAHGIPGVRTGSASGIIEMRYLPGVLDALELLRASGHWSTDDQRAMEEWASAYLDWLWSSSRGRYVYGRQDNSASWYDVQVVGVALFLGRASFARNVIASSGTRRIAAQIEPDGRQPAELRRTRSLFYSIFNLRALMQLAELGRRVDVDLWSHEAPNGASIRAALDYLAPYADPANQWPKKEGSRVPPGHMLEPLRRGQLAYEDPSYGELIARIPEDATRDHVAQLLYPAPPCSGLPAFR